MTVGTQRTDMPLNSPAYYEELRRAVEVLLRGNEACGAEILKQAEGAFPSDVLRVLTLLADQELSNPHAQSVLKNLRDSLATASGARLADDLLPEPHPLDFDWRFSSSCLHFLGGRAELQGNMKICILGAPSLFRYLARRGRDVTLYDKNSLAIKRLTDGGFEGANECDLFEMEAGKELFDVVVADPPWYLEHYEAFLRVASAVISHGGYLLLSVLPRFTRTEASADRQRILELAFRGGLDIVEVKQASLSYESPPFEAATLLAEGIVDLTWRSGDLFVFRRSTRVSFLDRNGILVSASDGQWESVVVDGVVIRIRLETTIAAAPFTFRPASETGDHHLHSVSRRSPVRGRINLWTSRNVALSLSRTDCAISLLESFQNTNTVSVADQVRRVSVDFALDEVSSLELNKLAELLLVESRGGSSGPS